MLLRAGGGGKSGLALFSRIVCDGVKSSYTVQIPANIALVDMFCFMNAGGPYAAGLRFNGDAGANYDWTSLDYAQINNTFSVYAPALAGFAPVAANSTSEQAVNINGLNIGDTVIVSKPTHQPGLGIGNVRVSAANTLAITFFNVTGAPITPANETYAVFRVPSVIPIAKIDTYGDTSLHIGPGLSGHSLLTCQFTTPALPAAQHRTFMSHNVEDAAQAEKHDHYGRWNSNAAVISVTFFNVFGVAFNAGTIIEFFGSP